MSILGKINEIFSLQEIKKTQGVEVWVVSWTSVGSAGWKTTFCSGKRRAKAFIHKGDAELFKKSLQDAQTLLQNDNDIQITIEQQK